MSSIPLVSVVMSVYNGRPYLKRAVLSIVDQTFDNFEFIIINDGSTDGSSEILERYATNDDRIRLVHQENKGLIASLNRGLDMARGRYVARMDADDISRPSRFERQVRFLDSNPGVGVVGASVDVIDEEGETIDHWTSPVEPGLLAWRLSFNTPYVHPTIMARRSVLNELGGYAEWPLHSEDYELWTRAVQISRLSAVPHTLLKFRLSKNSITGANREKQMETNCKVAAAFHRCLLGESADEDIASFLVWLHQFNLETASEETGVENFRSVFEYLRVFYRAHVERFCKYGSRIRVRREVLPRLDLMADELAKHQGWEAGVWHKARARLMPPIKDAILWMWRAARDRLSSTTPPVP